MQKYTVESSRFCHDSSDQEATTIEMWVDPENNRPEAGGSAPIPPPPAREPGLRRSARHRRSNRPVTAGVVAE